MSGGVTHISLDHDLGDDKRGTGYDVLAAIEEMAADDCNFTVPSISVHTQNPPARARMEAAVEAIARASSVSRGLSQLEHMQPALKAVLDELKGMILDDYGECVNRIVIIGSAVGPGFRVGESDVDVVVLTNTLPSKIQWDEHEDFKAKVNTAFSGPWSKIDIINKNEKQVHLLGTNYLPCYEGQVLRGFVLYDDGTKESYKTLSKEDARKEVVESYLFQAWQWLKFASGTNGDCAWSACRSACRALHAVLASHDVNFTDKRLRWNIVELARVVEELSPGLHVEHLVEMLPDDLAFIDFDDVKPEDELSIRERRSLVAAAVRITKICERFLGVDVGERKFFIMKYLRRFEKEMMKEEEGDAVRLHSGFAMK
jgi:predicted nucleotidyltransferase